MTIEWYAGNWHYTETKLVNIYKENSKENNTNNIYLLWLQPDSHITTITTSQLGGPTTPLTNNWEWI